MLKAIMEIEIGKILTVAAFALTLGFSGMAVAADIENLSGQSCGDDSGEWHFINNQTGRNAERGDIWAEWSTGESCHVYASKVNKSTQHFNCTAGGTLVSAMTNLPGRLVLSDFSCEKTCEKDCEPPPPCEKDCEPPKDPK
jgi:hypothetical protein